MEKYHGKSTEQIIRKLMPGSVRSSVVMVWVVINFMILTPFLFPPTFTIYLYIILPFLLTANIWGYGYFFVNQMSQGWYTFYIMDLWE